MSTSTAPSAPSAPVPAAAIAPPRRAARLPGWLLLGITVGALAVAPLFLYPIFLMKLLCVGLFACSFNLLIGYAGLLSFGHAAFFGMASYTAAHAAKVWGLPPELAILLGTAVGAGLGLLFGVVAIRRQGIYFAMITLGLAQMVYFFALQARFTHGEDGIQSVPRGYLFGAIDLDSNLAMYGVVAAIFLGGYLLTHRIVNSPFGAVLQAIRDNPSRAISLGFQVNRYKLLAFVLSATLAGLAGSTKAIALQLATLTDVHWMMSGEVVLMTLVGGMGTLPGPVVGSALIITLHDYLATAGVPVPVFVGATFIICILLFRRGIVGEVMARTKFRRS